MVVLLFFIKIAMLFSFCHQCGSKIELTVLLC